MHVVTGEILLVRKVWQALIIFALGFLFVLVFGSYKDLLEGEAQLKEREREMDRQRQEMEAEAQRRLERERELERLKDDNDR